LSVDLHDECQIRPEIQKIFDSMDYERWNGKFDEEYRRYILTNKNNEKLSLSYENGFAFLNVNYYNVNLNCKETNLLISGLKNTISLVVTAGENSKTIFLQV
jgi:hypothetical protein